MPIESFIQRLSSHSEIESGASNFLEELVIETREIAAGSFVIRSGGEPKYGTLLNSGVAISHKFSGNGGRQILAMFFPGEMIDFDGLLLRPIDHNVQAISKCEITTFENQRLLELLFSRPDIGKAMMREASIKSAIAREWMTNLGRRDSRTKVAHFLCELSMRMGQGDITHVSGFDLPITQEQIADVIGATPMHVGRVLRDLVEEKLIERNKKAIDILDWERLKLAGDFSPDYLRMGAK